MNHGSHMLSWSHTEWSMTQDDLWPYLLRAHVWLYQGSMYPSPMNVHKSILIQWLFPKKLLTRKTNFLCCRIICVNRGNAVWSVKNTTFWTEMRINHENFPKTKLINIWIQLGKYTKKMPNEMNIPCFYIYNVKKKGGTRWLNMFTVFHLNWHSAIFCSTY